MDLLTEGYRGTNKTVAPYPFFSISPLILMPCLHLAISRISAVYLSSPPSAAMDVLDPVHVDGNTLVDKQLWMQRRKIFLFSSYSLLWGGIPLLWHNFLPPNQGFLGADIPGWKSYLSPAAHHPLMWVLPDSTSAKLIWLRKECLSKLLCSFFLLFPIQFPL